MEVINWKGKENEQDRLGHGGGSDGYAVCRGGVWWVDLVDAG